MTSPERPMAVLDWQGGLRFAGGAPATPIPPFELDGDGVTGQSPVITLLCAAAACAGADIVSILRKKRVTLVGCRIEAGGERRDEYPRRFVSIWLRFVLRGDGLTEQAAHRAVELSVEKYCSVLSSLNPDIPIRTEVVIE